MKYIFMILISILSLPALAQGTLPEYIDLVEQNNPELRAKYKAFEAALAQMSGAGALPQPNLSMGYFLSTPETRVGPQIAKFSLSQMFPWFGTLRAQNQVAALQAELAHLEFVDAREALKIKVKTLYFQLWELNMLDSLVRENVDLLKIYEELARTRFASGSGSMRDVIRLQTEKLNADTQLELIKLKQHPLKLNLYWLSNETLDTARIVIQDSIDVGYMTMPESLTSDSTSVHPRIQSSALQLEVAKMKTVLAKKSAYPSFGAGLEYMIVGRRQDANMMDNGKDIFMPMISIGLPLWRKPINSQIKRATLAEEQYEYNYDNQHDAIQSMKDIEWYEMQTGQREMQLYEEQIKLIESSLQLTLTDYSNGLADFEEVIKLQQMQLLSKKKYFEAARKFLVSQAKLQYLMTKTDLSAYQADVLDLTDK